MNKMRTIIKTAAFLTVLVAIHAGLRQAYYAFITPRDTYLQEQESFTAHEGAYDVALFGDSHALLSVQARLLGNAANLSQLGEGYIERYYKLDYNLRKNPGKLKTIILPLDMHSFSPVWGENFNIVSSSRYVNFADYVWQTGFTTKALRDFVHYYVFPYADCTPEIYAALPSNVREKTRAGAARFDRNLAKTPPNAEQIKKLMITHYGEQREWRSEKALRYFNRIKTLCQKENINVVFVRFPVSKLYFDAASEIVPIDEFDRFTQELVDDWPGAMLLNYRGLYFDRDDLFADLNHLNFEGSIIFSQRFARDLTDLGALHPAIETAEP
ncbi:MAG TPA: hypothetical protein PKY01_20615 [Candidatus Hydrogenedentes bacterium]|nr:hypothetical protein [Candidatus Hydrogenedentota bacterium]HQH54842.1 hypothetical protein [Candidatus Hydrogenedentota bacterium]